MRYFTVRSFGIFDDTSLKFSVCHADLDRISLVHLVLKDQSRREGLHVFLNISLERSRAKGGVVGRICHKFLGLVCEADGDLSLLQALIEVRNDQIDDARDVVLAQGLEEDDLIKSVEELGTESARISCAPMLEVMIRIVFLKSTVLP